MSAGGLSYSGLTSYGKAILPSVEAGLGSMNLLRDPPKAVFTRQKTRVGDSSEITQQIQDSCDRADEAILAYPRGINPMVSVSYQNHGNNGGQYSGGMKDGCINVGQARLPYSLGAGGFSFRPPVLRQENLMPLSRQPRVWTKATTNCGKADFTKKLYCPKPAALTREVKNSLLKASARPTCTYKLEKPVKEPFEIKYVIQNPIKVQGNSGLKPSVKYHENTEINTDNYTHETNHSNVTTQKMENKYVSSPHEFIDVDPHIVDKINIDYKTTQSGNGGETYIHTQDIQLDKNLPQYSANTNMGKNIHKQVVTPTQREYTRNTPLTNMATNTSGRAENMNNMSRKYNLPPKIQAGGFERTGTIPTVNRDNIEMNFTSRKAELQSRANTNFDNRYRHGIVVGR